jgi:hypothetical protein
MKRCEANIKSGRRCLNAPMQNSEFCSVHQDEISSGNVVAVTVGSVIGNALLPGLGGILLGGLAGSWVRSIVKDTNMKKSRVFISFDFDHDRALKDFILGQAKLSDSPFEVIDHSLKEAAPEVQWESKARAAIRRADIVLVMVGPYTHKANGVLKEVAMAREAGIKIVQIIGYKDSNYTPVPNAGRLYSWSWENLKLLLAK